MKTRLGGPVVALATFAAVFCGSWRAWGGDAPMELPDDIPSQAEPQPRAQVRPGEPTPPPVKAPLPAVLEKKSPAPPTKPTSVATPPEETMDDADEPPACGAPPTGHAPDPRCGEALDGRAPAPSEHDVARGALAVPRVATRIVLWPVVEGTDVLEHHHVFDWMDAIFTTDDGLVGVRPLLSYTTGFRPTAGVRFFYRRLPGNTEIAAHYETAGLGVNIARLHFHTLERMGIFLNANWLKRDDLLFAGTGPNTTTDLQEMGQGIGRYGTNALGADALWSHKLPGRLFVRLHGDVLRRTYQDSSVRAGQPVSDFYGLPPAACAALGLPVPCVNPMEMPGFASGERLVHYGVGLGADLRTPGREGPGASVIADVNFARGIAGDPSQHATLAGEAVGALGGINRTFILRGRAAVIEKMGDAPIPFEELVIPAGSAGMRGFPEGRFRGESGLVGTAEYRWYISSYLDATLFSDVGTVAGHNFSGLSSSHWFPSYGVGMRWFTTQGAYWEAAPRGGVQLAYGDGYGFRLLLMMAGF